MHNFLVRIAACFIWNAKKRRSFRKRHINKEIRFNDILLNNEQNNVSYIINTLQKMERALAYMIAPLCDAYFDAPNKSYDFLCRKYGNIFGLPNDVGDSHHIFDDKSYVNSLSKNKI